MNKEAWYYNLDGELSHYGIKGQKWGEKNGPPYPLGASDHSSTEKKAKQENKKKSTAVKENNSSLILSQPETKKRLSTKQKILIGGAIALSFVAAFEAYHFIDSGEAIKLAQKGKMFSKTRMTNYVPWKFEESLASNMDSDEILEKVVKPINPGFPESGHTMNCKRCTFAYELRRRGYDVMATPSVHGAGQNLYSEYQAMKEHNYYYMSSFYKERVDIVKSKLPSGATPAIEIYNALGKMTNGARGDLTIFRNDGSGHSIAWEIVNNKPVIFDCQSGSVYKTINDFIEAPYINSAYITRLDNKALNEDFLMKWIMDAE